MGNSVRDGTNTPKVEELPVFIRDISKEEFKRAITTIVKMTLSNVGHTKRTILNA